MRTADSCTPWSVDVPAEQPFDLSKVIVGKSLCLLSELSRPILILRSTVGNAACASTCSAFTTIMQELHGVKIVNFGAAKGAYSGMAGAEVLEWNSLDSEFKVSVLQFVWKICIDVSSYLLQTANLKELGAPDLFVNGNFRNNWR